MFICTNYYKNGIFCLKKIQKPLEKWEKVLYNVGSMYLMKLSISNTALYLPIVGVLPSGKDVTHDS